MLYDYCIRNKLTKKQILNILQEYSSIKPFGTNDVEDVKNECQVHGLQYVSNKYGVKEDTLKQYPHFRFKKRDENGKVRQPTGVHVKPSNPVIDIFEEE